MSDGGHKKTVAACALVVLLAGMFTGCSHDDRYTVDQGLKTRWRQATPTGQARAWLPAPRFLHPDHSFGTAAGGIDLTARDFLPCTGRDTGGDPLEADRNVADYAARVVPDYQDPGVWLAQQLVVYPTARAATRWMRDFAGTAEFDPTGGLQCTRVADSDLVGGRSSFQGPTEDNPSQPVVWVDRYSSADGPLGRDRVRAVRVGNAVLTTVVFSADAPEAELAGLARQAEAGVRPALDRYRQ